MVQLLGSTLVLMTYRAKGWFFAAAISFSFWVLIALVSVEIMMQWEQPNPIEEIADEAAV
ncbi:hypothetical protein DevBK_16405 [Devosia sp. BK]|uniref:hypothetical protein n=1 Tax=Devosia sp. BK TaxID=2871706 RepID=UPI00293B6755|nr:hypothetical protein [Devosia sp. BK]MDV3252922.1 hypothetical protein [Devosia sp. BK]